MKKIIFLLFASLSTHAQTDMTIFKLLKLKEGGCTFVPSKAGAIDSVREAPVVDEATIDGSEDPETETSEKTDFEKLRMTNLETFKMLNLTDGSLDTLKRFTFPSGYSFYEENRLLGLKKTASNTIQLPAQFTWVIPNGHKGFVGYKNQWCNYYNSTGKKLFQQNYYFIEPIFEGFYIFQTAQGKGVMDSTEKIILKAQPYRIDTTTISDKHCIRIIDNTVYGTLMLLDKKKPAQNFSSPNSDDDYIIESGIFYNLTTKKLLICEDDFEVQYLSPKDQTIAIRDQKTDLWYFSDTKGKLKTSEAFLGIMWIEELKNYLAAPKLNTDTKASRKEIKSKVKVGLMDKNGHWIINPKFNGLKPINNELLIAQNEMGLCGIINLKEEIREPFQYEKINMSSHHDLAICIMPDKSSKIINIKDFSIKAQHSDISELIDITFCKKNYYIAHNESSEFLVDLNLNRKTKDFDRIFCFEGKALNGLVINDDAQPTTDVSSESVSKEYYFDCDLNPITFLINGISYEKVNSLIKVNEELTYISINDTSGYFILSDGTTKTFDGGMRYTEPAGLKGLYTVNFWNGTMGLINQIGDWVIPAEFSYISSFNLFKSFARFNSKDGSSTGLMQPNGDLLFGTKYQEVRYDGLSIFFVKKDNLWGLVDQNDKILIPLKYNSLTLNGGLIIGDSQIDTKIFDITGMVLTSKPKSTKKQKSSPQKKTEKYSHKK